MKKVILILALLLLPSFALAQEQVDPVELWFFYLDSCPYCAQSQIFLEELKGDFPNLIVRSYEVGDNNADNAAVFSLMLEAYGIEDAGVPAFFMGGNFIDGYDESIGSSIRQIIEQCDSVSCPSPSQFLKNYTPIEDKKDMDISWPWVIGGGLFLVILISIFIPRKKRVD